MRHSAISTVLKIALIVLITVNFLHAQLQFARDTRAITSRHFQELQLTDAEALRRGFLNYSTAAADLAWVALVVNYGEGKRHWAKYSNLEHNASVVQALDPRFRRLYDWFPAVYLVFRWPQRYEDVEVTTRFVRRGFDVFPHDGALPFHASMSYIGVRNPPEGPEATYRRVIEFAEIAAERGDPDAAGVLPFFRAKLRGETEVDPADEVTFLTTMLARATTSADRRRLEEQLAQLARSDEGAKAMLERSRAFAAQHAAQRPYVSAELYSVIGDD